jgi:hypothetical protein
MLLPEPTYVAPTPQDAEIFAHTVCAEHYLRRVTAAIDFERYRGLLAQT